MQTADQWFESHLDTQRTMLRRSLDDIADEVGIALQDAGLHFPVYITVRDSGEALATIATPANPSKGQWRRASAIVCQIMGRKIGIDRLTSQELACTAATPQ